MGRQIWTKDKVIAELKRVRANGPVKDKNLESAARRHFGSLRAALEAAGMIRGDRESHYFRWTKETVIEAIVKRHAEGKCIDSIHKEDQALYAAGKTLLELGMMHAAKRGFQECHLISIAQTKCSCGSLSFTRKGFL